MTIDTVALFSPGDMGHAIGRVLVENGIRVVTNLDDRSDRTRELAEAADIVDLRDDLAAVEDSDLVLSILPPDRAYEMALRLASAIALAKDKPVYIDLNAISPSATIEISEIIQGAGAAYVDGGIIGGPPKGTACPRLYISGDDAILSHAMGLVEGGMDMRPISGGIGAASALKMCYAAITKGLTAIATTSMTGAKAYGVDRELAAELNASQRYLAERFDRDIPGMAPKAYRWVGEMEEIARTFGEVGLDPRMYLGAAEIYKLITSTVLGDETPEKRTVGFTAGEVADIAAAKLAEGAESGTTGE